MELGELPQNFPRSHQAIVILPRKVIEAIHDASVAALLASLLSINELSVGLQAFAIVADHATLLIYVSKTGQSTRESRSGLLRKSSGWDFFVAIVALADVP
jgi:hypothetical protein